jgi:hypothetical protein
MDDGKLFLEKIIIYGLEHIDNMPEKVLHQRRRM